MRIAKIFPLALALAIALPGILNAQQENDREQGKSYRLLQMIVVGSSAPDSEEELSPTAVSALSSVGPELRYRSYSPVASLYGPLGFGGQAQWKVITKNFGSYSAENMPIISEWNLGALEPVPGSPGMIEFKRFLFLSRVPSRFGESVNYETIQVTLNRVRVPVGKASVIGNLPVPETGEMLFFVVKIDEIS
ncbi:MAG: hypothetical protein IPM63_17040 [Acidobacteriota bacterium]|nr:MAG: hypothetical protein IPM63_17040 [Acidobacteriota bacterium]